MNAKISRPIEHVEAQLHADLARGQLVALAGILQRADYRRRELKVIAGGELWNFTLAADCQFWFDERPAILRCFHPLDAVQLLFQRTAAGDVVKAMYAREKQAA